MAVAIGVTVLIAIIYWLVDCFEYRKNSKPTTTPTNTSSTQTTQEPKRKWNPDEEYNGTAHTWIRTNRRTGDVSIDEAYIEYMEELEKSQSGSNGVLQINTKKPY